MKHPSSQMIWGTMSCHRTAGLYFLPPNTTMNGPRYVEILHVEIHNCTVFMQDGISCHRSKVVSEFLSTINYVKVLDWPRNCSNLNPIENLWDILKNKVTNKQPTSAKHFQEVIKESWVKDLT